MPYFSVVVPVYGAEAYLPRALDSVLAQTYTDWECILVDDGSPDNSGTICDKYAAKDSRFRVFHQENQGMGIALDRGIAAAKGQYLVTLDNDDMLSPMLMECAAAAQKPNNENIVLWRYTSGNTLHQKGEVDFQTIPKEQTPHLFLDDLMFYRWNKIFSLEFIRTCNLKTPNIHYAQDTIFSMTYAAQWFKAHPNGCYVLIDKFLYFHDRSNPGSITAGYGKTYCSDMLMQLELSPDWFSKDFPADDAAQHALYHFYLRILAGCYYTEFRHHGFAAAKRAVEHPASQRIAANAKSLGLHSPCISPILKKNTRLACMLGKPILEKGTPCYISLCRWCERLHI